MRFFVLGPVRSLFICSRDVFRLNCKHVISLNGIYEALLMMTTSRYDNIVLVCFSSCGLTRPAEHSRPPHAIHRELALREYKF